jgi:hypothetical protein
VRLRTVAVLGAGVFVVAAPHARAVMPSLYIGYNAADCTFRLTNDAGTAVAGIYPGTYQVVITTPDPFGVYDQSGPGLMGCKGFVKFRLSGPGVSIFTTLENGDSASEMYTETFEPGGTYTLQDDTNIAGTRRSFTVATSGSPPAPVTPASQKTHAAESLPLRGQLDATVSSGKVTLTRKGKALGAVRAGRYVFAVHDASKRDGFSLQAPKGWKHAVTDAAFVGWRDVIVPLQPGRWSFFTPGGEKTTFLVVS